MKSKKVVVACAGNEYWEIEAVVAGSLCYHYTLHNSTLLVLTHIPSGKFLPGTETSSPQEAHFLLQHLSRYPGWDRSDNELWEQRDALKARIARAVTLLINKFPKN